MCIHYLGHFSPLPPPQPSTQFSPHLKAGHVLPLSLVLLKKRDKEDKVFDTSSKIYVVEKTASSTTGVWETGYPYLLYSI
jgi:hypothetical protein